MAVAVAPAAGSACRASRRRAAPRAASKGARGEHPARHGPSLPTRGASLRAPAARGVGRAPVQRRAANVAVAAAEGAAMAMPDDNRDIFDKAFSGAVAVWRCVCFYVWTIVLSVPLFALMAAMFPFVSRFDAVRKKAFHIWANLVWANMSTLTFYHMQRELEKEETELTLAAQLQAARDEAWRHKAAAVRAQAQYERSQQLLDEMQDRLARLSAVRDPY